MVGVLDGQGNVQRVRASGTYVILPKITGIADNIRQRWPIAPVQVKKDPGAGDTFALKHSLAALAKGALLLNSSMVNFGICLD